MRWNWQLSGWPKFTWNAQRLAKAEELFLTGGGVLLGSVRHLEEADKTSLTIEAMSIEALTTSEIEGEILDRASVQSSIRWQLGFGNNRRRVGEAESGIAEMLVNLYRSYADRSAMTCCSAGIACWRAAGVIFTMSAATDATKIRCKWSRDRSTHRTYISKRRLRSGCRTRCAGSSTGSIERHQARRRRCRH
jgi:hypothetical protein